MLCFQTYCRTTWECGTMITTESISEIVSVKLNSRFCSVHFQRTSAVRFLQACSKRQLPYFTFVKNIVMVVTLTIAQLFVISLNVLSYRLWRTEIEWSTLHFKYFSSWDRHAVDRQIEISIYLAFEVKNVRCRISHASKCEECVMGEVDDCFLVCRGKVFNYKLIIICQRVFHSKMHFT